MTTLTILHYPEKEQAEKEEINKSVNVKLNIQQREATNFYGYDAYYVLTRDQIEFLYKQLKIIIE